MSVVSQMPDKCTQHICSSKMLASPPCVVFVYNLGEHRGNVEFIKAPQCLIAWVTLGSDWSHTDFTRSFFHDGCRMTFSGSERCDLLILS